MHCVNAFRLICEDDEVVGFEIGFSGGTIQKFAYPGETDALELAASKWAAADSVEVSADDAGWWEWLSTSPGLMDGRVIEQIAPMSELSGELSGDSEAEELTSVELSGDLSGDSTSEVTVSGVSDEEKPKRGAGRKKRKKRSKKLREGSGCKQPDQVFGWESGKLLCVTKNHRTHGDRPWGRCEYRVRCHPDGSYTLEYFAGSRKDLKAGTHWKTASEMFFALLDLDPKKIKHHRMTVKRFFNI